MKYYNIRVTNLGMGWFRWTPKYLKGRSKYFFWFNWRIDWEVSK